MLSTAMDSDLVVGRSQTEAGSGLIQVRKLTQSSAARLFGVTQPRVSDLVRGRIDLFNIEGLVGVRGSKRSGRSPTG